MRGIWVTCRNFDGLGIFGNLNLIYSKTWPKLLQIWLKLSEKLLDLAQIIRDLNIFFTGSIGSFALESQFGRNLKNISAIHLYNILCIGIEITHYVNLE